MPFYMIRGDITKLQGGRHRQCGQQLPIGGRRSGRSDPPGSGTKTSGRVPYPGRLRNRPGETDWGIQSSSQICHPHSGSYLAGRESRRTELLVSCYRNSLELASKEGCKTLAFPLISAGVYGYPKDQAVQVAVETIQTFLLTHDVSVTLVLFVRDAATVSKSLFTDISSYIDAQFIKEQADQGPECVRREVAFYRDAAKGMPMSAGVPGSQKRPSLISMKAFLKCSFGRSMLPASLMPSVL